MRSVVRRHSVQKLPISKGNDRRTQRERRHLPLPSRSPAPAGKAWSPFPGRWSSLLLGRRSPSVGDQMRLSRTSLSGCAPVPDVGLRVQGLGFRVQGRGSGFRVQGSGFGVQGSGFRVQGSGFRVQGYGSHPWWLGLRVES